MSLYHFLLRSTDLQLAKQGSTYLVTNSLNWGGSESRVLIAVVGLPDAPTEPFFVICRDPFSHNRVLRRLLPFNTSINHPAASSVPIVEVTSSRRTPYPPSYASAANLV